MTATRIRDYCLAPSRAADAPATGGGYRRLFPELDPLECEDNALHALGRAGGACDAAAGPVEGGEGQDAEGAAGWPVFGQFVAHDITADRSPLTHHAELAGSATPAARADLEVVYGDGPAACRTCTTATTRPSSWSGQRRRPPICPATPRGSRCSATRATTSTCDEPAACGLAPPPQPPRGPVAEDGVAEAELFEEARRAATWHYQWIVLHDFLPRLVGAGLAAELLGRRRPGTRRRRDGRSSRWSSPTPPTATATARSATATRSTRGRAGLPLFPDLIGFGPVPAERAVDWACCSTCRARRPRSAPSGSTAASPPA